MNPAPRHSVIAEADWDSLTPAQQECLRALARGTLGWGFRWGSEFRARFAVRTASPGRLPAGVAMYNERGGDRIAANPGDIVVCFRPGSGDAHIRRAIDAAAQGALVLAEADPLIAERFGGCMPMFSSPADLVEQVYRYLESPDDCAAAATGIAGRAEALRRPLISVIIFAYNAARWLPETIASALDQDYDNFEVVVIDDGSTDGTADVVRSIENPRLRYIAAEHRGAPAARNRGIAEARGECIVWLGADDVLEKRALSSQAGVMTAHPGADVVYGDIMLCDASLNDVRLIRYRDWFSRTADLPAAMIEANVIPDGGTLIRASCYGRIGTYNEQFPRAHDYEWWSRLVAFGATGVAFGATGAAPGAASGATGVASGAAGVSSGCPGAVLFKHNAQTVYRWRWHGANLGAGSGRKLDTRYEARIVRGLLKRHSLRELFPDAGWTTLGPDRAGALSRARAAEILSSYGDKGGVAVLRSRPEETGIASQQGVAMRAPVIAKHPHGMPKQSARFAVAGEAQQGRPSVTYLITNILGVTGGNQTLLQQANALHDRGYRVTIVTRSARPEWCEIRPEVIRVPSSGAMSPWVPPSDAVISTYFMNAAELASIECPVKIYFAQGDQYVFDGRCEARDPEVRKLHALLKKMSRMSYLMPGVRFIANSGALAARVEKAYGRRADGILPVCVDLDLFTPLAKTSPGGIPRVLVVGPDNGGSELEPLAFKGMADVRRALEILKEQGERFATVRISSTPRSVFAGFPCEFHIAPPDLEKRRLYGTADVLVYASHYDSCPRPPLEAMAAGAAVVCTSTEGAREYCSDGENAVLVPVRSPESLAEGIRRVIHDGALREKIVRGGLATARARPQKREWDELETILSRYTGKEQAMNTEARGAEQGLPREGAPLTGGTIDDITAVRTDSAFARAVRSVFEGGRPAKLVETGTFVGNGTTTVIASALRDLGIADARFYSIEVNPGLHAIARKNLSASGLLPFVQLLNGLSVPRGLLPGREEIEERTVRNVGAEPVYVDHDPGERVDKYMAETNFPDVPDDLLGRVMAIFGGKPDFVLLDSGGHMGYIEFTYLLSLIKAECIIALDDIFHVKHQRSFREMSADPRFEIITSVREKAGFCIARFTPVASVAQNAPQHAPQYAPQADDIARRLAVAAEQFGKKEFTGALQTLQYVEGVMGTMPGSATMDEAVAGVETVRGMSYLGMNDLEHAKDAFEKALKMQPDSSQACAGLGEVFFLAGLDNEAKVMFEHAVALSENNLFGRAGLAKSNKALGLPVGHSNLALQGGREGSAL